jgi:energy-coupling factor transport system permease protein
VSSKFEFLENTLIGQYIPRETWLHQRDPRAKLIAFLLVFFSLIFTPTLLGLGIGLFIVLSLYLIAQLPSSSTWRSIIRALPFVIILALLQIIFMKDSGGSEILFEIFGKSIYVDAFMSGVILVFRFILLIALLNAVVMTLSTSQITTALFYLLKPLEIIRFPVNDLTMIIQITLRYIPLVSQIAEKTVKAQAARGGDWEKRGFNPIKQAKMVIPLIVPIMVTSLKRAETMAIAMESRGFNAAKQRSSFYELSFTWHDMIFIGLSIAISLVMLLAGAILKV